MRRKVGITSTVPIEVIYASDSAVLDLNNVFVADPSSLSLVEQAERVGFPESSCAWIKGIYSCVRPSGVDSVIAVTQGDCSNTHALMETLEFEGVKTIPFMYPYDKDRRFLRFQIDKLSREFGAAPDRVAAAKDQLDGIRERVRYIDQLTWQDGMVTGFENHCYHLACSDMNGDPTRFAGEVETFIRTVREREPAKHDLRLGYVGIPPIMNGVYAFIESLGATVVFNELQRQFSMPHLCDDIVEQYLRYTYPYHIRFRLEDIRAEVKRRSIDGVIHYVQAFCFRQVEDIIIRKQLGVPVLTIEGNRPGKIDSRTRIRIEAFLDMLRARRSRLGS
jgi:benzoyl-CoA reductase/2-hydroxyglutaryl-CoA dehydratase subunit BcrC/BadD/HgdB